jgi:hypothetical protein
MWTLIFPHHTPHARLRCNARLRYGCIRQELAGGMKESPGRAGLQVKDGVSTRPPALGVNRRARRGHDDASRAVVTEATDPTQPRVAFRRSKLETKRTEFYCRTAALTATKEPPRHEPV